MEVYCQLVATKGPGIVRCANWVEVGIGWWLHATKSTVTSNFNSVVVWVDLVSSRFRVIVERSKLLCFAYRKTVISQILSGMVLYLNIRSQVIKIWKWSRYRNFVQRLIWKFSSICSTEGGDCYPIRWVYVGYDWTVREVSISEELSENGISEKRETNVFRSRWMKFGDFMQQCKDWAEFWICTRRRRWLNRSWCQTLRRVSLREEYIKVLFEESSDSQFFRSSKEDSRSNLKKIKEETEKIFKS